MSKLASRFAGDDLAAAQHFLADMAPIARSCMGRVYVRVNGAWVRNKKLVDKVFLARCLSANIQFVGDNGVVRKMSSNVATAKRIVKAAQALLPDDPAFEEVMWRSVLGKLCFRDGLWDFKLRRFFTYEERADVMPAQVIPRDFPQQRPSPEEAEAVRQRVLLSTLGSEDKVRTLLELRARALAGEHEHGADKQWTAMMQGRKGVLQGLDKATFGAYVNTQHHAAQDAYLWMVIDAYNKDSPVLPRVEEMGADTSECRVDIGTTAVTSQGVRVGTAAKDGLKRMGAREDALTTKTTQSEIN